MGCRLLFMLFAVFVSTTTAISLQDPPARSARAIVEGVVIDGLTGLPLAGANAGGQTTDAQGRFSIEVNAGQITLNVGRDGYRPARLEGRKLSGNIPSNMGIPLNLAPGEKLSSLTVKLFPPALLTGRVFNDRGEAMLGAEILPFLYLYNEAGTRFRANLVAANQRTNDLGEFRIGNLDTGDYYLEIRPSSPDLGGTSGSVLAPLFYPNALDPTRADPIHVEAGQTMDLGNISAVAVRGGAIRFRLINQIGEAPRGTAGIASLFREGDFTTTVRSEMRPHDQLGQLIDFGRFPPGNYYFRAGLTSYSPGINEGRVRIEHGTNDIELDVPVVKFLPSTVNGRAILEASTSAAQPVSGVRLVFNEIGANPTSLTLRTSPIGVIALTSAADGTFPDRTLSPATPPYAYRLRVLDIPDGLYLSEIRGVDPERFSVEAGRETAVTVVLSAGAGSIEGIVRDTAQRPVSFGVVAMIPVDGRFSQSLVSAATAQDGAFRLHAGPGDYRLYAWRELIGAPYLNAEFMEKYKDSGTPVRIPADGRLVVNMTVLED